jgi:hypothetical protein
VLAVIIIASFQKVLEAPDAVNVVVPRSVPTVRAFPRPVQVSRDCPVPIKALQVVRLCQRKRWERGVPFSIMVRERNSKQQSNMRDSSRGDLGLL